MTKNLLLTGFLSFNDGKLDTNYFSCIIKYIIPVVLVNLKVS